MYRSGESSTKYQVCHSWRDGTGGGVKLIREIEVDNRLWEVIDGIVAYKNKVSDSVREVVNGVLESCAQVETEQSVREGRERVIETVIHDQVSKSGGKIWYGLVEEFTEGKHF
jgi:hypothetical protein